MDLKLKTKKNCLISPTNEKIENVKINSITNDSILHNYKLTSGELKKNNSQSKIK
jgi:hypothetical protein